MLSPDSLAEEIANPSIILSRRQATAEHSYGRGRLAGSFPDLCLDVGYFVQRGSTEGLSQPFLERCDLWVV
jgi:hypothetical protein